MKIEDALKLEDEFVGLLIERNTARKSGNLDEFYDIRTKGLNTYEDIMRAYVTEKRLREEITEEEAFNNTNLFGNDLAPAIPRTLNGLISAGYALYEILTKMYMTDSEISEEIDAGKAYYGSSARQLYEKVGSEYICIP